MTQLAMTQLSKAQVVSFHENGFLFPIRVFGAAETRR